MAARNRNLAYLFSLDKYAISSIQKFFRRAIVVATPDPSDPSNNEFTPARSKTVVVLAGRISSTKGTFEALEALHALKLSTPLELRLVGPILEDERLQLESAIASANKLEHITVICTDIYHDEESITDEISSADAVLVTYKGHIGSSNILVKAASAAVPVIGTEFGLIGETIRRNGLGIVVNSTDPIQIADAIADVVNDAIGMDNERASSFAEFHSPENFARLIYRTILDQAI